MLVQSDKDVLRASPPPLKKVVVVFKTHFDLGFTGLPDEVMSFYTGPMFSAVQLTMRQTADEPENLRYNWTLPAWALDTFLHSPNVPPRRRAAARKLVEEGRLNWHAWPFTTHTAFCGLEDLVRGLHISRSLSEEFGRAPTGAKQTDVPGHTWVLPSLLVRAGVKFLHLGCNAGSHPPHVPPLFWWEGPDGLRLLTYYSAGGYGTPLLPPEGWALDTWLSVQQTEDNIGPQSPEELAEIRHAIESGAPGAEILFGELGDFAESLMRNPEQLALLPVVAYDMADTWIHGVGTMPREVSRVRGVRRKLLAAELLAAKHAWPLQAPGADLAKNRRDLARQVAPHIDAAYRELLLFGEHTWGLDVKSTIKRGFGPAFLAARQTEPYRRLEASWTAKGAYVSRAEDALERAMDMVREADANAPDAMSTPRSIEATSSSRNGRQPNVLENMHLRVEVDPVRGGIASLFDKHTAREWVDGTSDQPFGGYRYDLYSAGDIAEFMRAYGLFFQDWFVQDFGKAGYPEKSVHHTAYACDFRLSKETIEVGSRRASVLRLEGGRIDNPALPCQGISIELK
ncbi:MAG: DUF5054 domain-containing protein, partial [Chloroflexota bacterium]|nr:DUF5054 domain-containing protein [Chloroflexota bacterium]